jgi:hypothetical protein
MPSDLISAEGGAMPADSQQTRRSALRLFGALPVLAILPIAAMVPLADTASAADLDAPLLALLSKWEAARLRLNEASAGADAAGARLADFPAPAPILCANEDVALELCAKYWVGTAYSVDAIEDFRANPRRRYWVRAAVASDNLPTLTDDSKVEVSAPWPEAQARANEIVAAFDGWQRAIKRNQDETGIVDAEARFFALSPIEMDLREEVAATPARSMTGLFAKARHVERNLELDGLLEGETPSLDEPQSILILSVFRDFLSLGSSQASAAAF